MPTRGDSPLGMWATVAPSQTGTVLMHASDELSPVASVSKKAKVVMKEAEGEEEEEEKTTFEEVKKVDRLFKANIDTMADDVWESRGSKCSPCITACEKMDTFYKMTNRMLSMLIHREQNMENKLAIMENRAVAMEQTAAEMEEEKQRLTRELDEARRGSTRSGVDVATSIEDRWR